MMPGSCVRRVLHDLAAEAQVWWVELDAYAGAVPLQGLGAAELARADRMPVPQAAQRLLASHHALRAILAEALQCAPEDLAIEPDEFGKPRLCDPAAPHFNLSRSSSQALIALSRQQPVGVDIELVREVAEREALADSLFTAVEREEWAQIPGSQRDLSFLLCWSRKEACGKALGVGLALPPAALEVGCVAPARRVGVSLGGAELRLELCSLQVPGDAVGALALAQPQDVDAARRAVGPSFRRPSLPS
jgi:4'-phosphopantetheinyl transferase